MKVHGIEFIRTGECKQCGACGCGDCPHHYVSNNLHWCSLYGLRERYCEECSSTHAACIGFPDNPWIHVVRDGICGFSFEYDGSMDDLPFLFGKPY